MRRKLGRWCAAALVAMMACSGAALAAPPAGTQGAAHAQAGSATSSTGAGSGGGGAQGPAQAGLGQGVSAAVAKALSAGAGGTVLAEAVHLVLSNEHPDVKGLTVAEAVYAQRNAGGTGNPFADLTGEAPWATPSVTALNAAGVIKGTSPTTFSPNDPVTLAELATMLDRLQVGTAPSGVQPPAGTPDWAAQGMAWAQGTGVLENEQGLGAPNAPLTRAQAVLMLINAAGLGQAATTDSTATIGLQGSAPQWAHGALALAIQLGILQGSNGQLLANGTLTRAQMAVLLARLAVLETEVAGSTTSGTSGGTSAG